MFAKIKKQFGTAGLILSIVALVAALGGGAYAATAHSSKAKAGKRGHRGFTGKTGAVGPAGPAGAKGDKGDPGVGTKGDPGASVASTALDPGDTNCPDGGSQFDAGASTTYACNGAEGSPWTAGGVLPPLKTEAGTWSVASAGVQIAPCCKAATVSISFPLPLPAALDTTATHVITDSSSDQDKAACDNGAGDPPSVDNPEAAPGQLCVFVGFLAGAIQDPTITSASQTEGAGTTGGVLGFFVDSGGPGFVYGSGSFAVTAPAAS